MKFWKLLRREKQVWAIKTKKDDPWVSPIKKTSSENCPLVNADGECHYKIGFLESWNKCERWRCPLKTFSLFARKEGRMKLYMTGPKRHEFDESDSKSTLPSIELECLSNLSEEE